MKCTNCFKDINEHEKICSYCGENNEFYVEKSIYVRPVEEVENKNNSSHMTNNIVYVNHVQEKSSAGLVCAILGLFIAGIIFGPIAISLSNKTNCAEPKMTRVLGIIDLVFGILGLIGYMALWL